jgi:hypothetical protein
MSEGFFKRISSAAQILWGELQSLQIAVSAQGVLTFLSIALFTAVLFLIL